MTYVLAITEIATDDDGAYETTVTRHPDRVSAEDRIRNDLAGWSQPGIQPTNLVDLWASKFNGQCVITTERFLRGALDKLPQVYEVA